MEREGISVDRKSLCAIFAARLLVLKKMRFRLWSAMIHSEQTMKSQTSHAGLYTAFDRFTGAMESQQQTGETRVQCINIMWKWGPKPISQQLLNSHVQLSPRYWVKSETLSSLVVEGPLTFPDVEYIIRNVYSSGWSHAEHAWGQLMTPWYFALKLQWEPYCPEWNQKISLTRQVWQISKAKATVSPWLQEANVPRLS